MVACDLADRTAREGLADRLSAPFGAPDILVTAAGINTRQPADEVTEEGWDVTLELNLSVPFFLSQALAPAMKAKGWGRIVNFASLQSTRAFPGGIAYGASKGGIAQLTRAMAEAWSPDGITANAIGPGFFPTELTGAVFSDPERAARNAAQTCIGRNGGAVRHRRAAAVSGLERLVLRDRADPDGGRGVHGEMKALVYTGPEALMVTDCPDPVPGAGEVLIRGRQRRHLRVRHARLPWP